MFLDDIDLSGVGVAKVKRSMSNWMKVADLIYTSATEEDLLVMIKLEVTYNCREYVISRLHSRYSALRTKREKVELEGYIKNKNNFLI